MKEIGGIFITEFAWIFMENEKNLTSSGFYSIKPYSVVKKCGTLKTNDGDYITPDTINAHHSK